jgi:hypothetical protein
MKSLATRSLEISEIVETISGIAAQTNLLALNATVEASSAGEAGARFATVADEVRKLSEEAERATSRVTSLVRAIQTETQAAVVGVEAGAKEVELGFEIATGAGQRLQEIAALTIQSANFAQTIASGTRNQLNQKLCSLWLEPLPKQNKSPNKGKILHRHCCNFPSDFHNHSHAFSCLLKPISFYFCQEYYYDSSSEQLRPNPRSLLISGCDYRLEFGINLLKPHENRPCPPCTMALGRRYFVWFWCLDNALCWYGSLKTTGVGGL